MSRYVVSVLCVSRSAAMKPVELPFGRDRLACFDYLRAIGQLNPVPFRPPAVDTAVRAALERSVGVPMKAAGIEPASGLEPTVNCDCGCIKCHHPCAAWALHPGGSHCRFLASLDAELQRMVAAWHCLPVAI
jgi:hypothetical protein